MIAAVVVLVLEHAMYKWTIPFLWGKPKTSKWKSLKLMFISQVISCRVFFFLLFAHYFSSLNSTILFSQRFYRIAHSDEIYEASHSAKELINIFKRRDIEAIFQKSFRVKKEACLFFVEFFVQTKIDYNFFLIDKKKQLESMHNSQLRKRPKLWALIEASSERYYTQISLLYNNGCIRMFVGKQYIVSAYLNGLHNCHP